MDRRFRRVAVFVGAAALAGGVGAGVAAQGNETPASPAAVSQRAGAPGRPGGMDLSALADQLGVSTDKLRAAMAAARPTAADPSAAGADAMAAALARELGLPTAKVSAALESVRPQGPPRGGPPPGGAPPSGAAPPDSTAPDASTATTPA